MQIHELQPKHSLKGKKRVGRGGKKGTYSGRGGKGQTARSGRKMEPFIREIIKRYPKLKAYRSNFIKNPFEVVNLDVIDKHFKDGEVVNSAVLVEKGLVNQVKGKAPHVKILGNGKLSHTLVFEGVKFSTSAKEAVEKGGSTVK